MSRDEKTARLWFIGPFPPPLSGQSHYNDTLRSTLQDRTELICLTTGESSFDKIRAAVATPLKLLTGLRAGDRVYTSAPGQAGLWLFLTVIMVLRLRKWEHFVHHHSFRSVKLAPLASHRWLAWIGGPQSRHVFLSETMRDRYAGAYLSPVQARCALVVPNAFLFAQDISEPPLRDGPVTVGHLSVMTREKGVDYILELIARLLPDTDLRFVLGGPIIDGSLRTEVEAMVSAHPNRVEWTGPIKGAAKTAFYARTDLLILPSKLIDEADPLVLLEAFAAGAIAMASDRGCIPDRVMTPDHLMSMDASTDAARLKALADDIVADRSGHAARAQEHARALFSRAQAQGEAFFAALGVT